MLTAEEPVPSLAEPTPAPMQQAPIQEISDVLRWSGSAYTEKTNEIESTLQSLAKISQQDRKSEKIYTFAVKYKYYAILEAKIRNLLGESFSAESPETELTRASNSRSEARQKVVFILRFKTTPEDPVAQQPPEVLPQAAQTAPDENLSTYSQGPFHYRRPWGLYAQGGASFVTQNINNPTFKSGLFESSQVTLRNGLGLWYDHFFVEGFWREPVGNADSLSFHPRWIQGFVGYSLELPSFWIVTPKISAFTGFEVYRNIGRSDSTFIESYQTSTFGLRSRFIIGKYFETGGDLQYSLVQGGNNIFVQGDAAYWLGKNWCFGAGYWLNSAQIDTSKGARFVERSYAIETYLKFVL